MMQAGAQIGRYVVLDRLGSGAMGEVYRACDARLDRVVALKVLLPLRAETPDARARFEREARLAARINHPCVAQIYDCDEIDDTPYIAMEFVPGRQLRAEMARPMKAPRLVFLGRQVLSGLVEAHNRGVVHRDLKPENILLSGRDQIKILDFGLAKPIGDDPSDVCDQSNVGLTGTPRYMAPEQVQGTPVDRRTDLYALGTMFYEMISGRPPHTGRTLAELLHAIVEDRPEPLSLDACPPKLARIIARAIEKRPTERYPSAEAMLEELDASVDRREPVRRLPSRSASRVPHPRAAQYAAHARDIILGDRASAAVAVDMTERAIELDPKYALAHAIHAEAAAALFNANAGAHWLDRSRDSLEKAEELDPDLPDIAIARARVVWTKTFGFPAETALRELRYVLDADPDHAGALRLWANVTSHIGLLDQADDAIARGLARSPHDEPMLMLSAGVAIARIDPQRALSTIARVVRLDAKREETTAWWLRAHALALLGNVGEGNDTVAECLERHPSSPMFLALSSLIAALQGRSADADARARRAERAADTELHPHHVHHLLACAKSVRGNADEALTWLRRTSDEGMPCWPWFARDPFLENVRRTTEGTMFLADLERRHAFFQEEFPLAERVLASVAGTEVDDRTLP